MSTVATVSCAICGRSDCGGYRLLGQWRVCMLCNPFRRCGQMQPDGSVCLGVQQSRPTPDDMSRLVCDKCGKESR